MNSINTLVPKGWAKLAGPVLREIARNGGAILQVKEKFGALRIYWGAEGGMGDDMYEVLRLATDRAEDVSRSVCIECGAAANMYVDGWMLPLCDKHAAEQGREEHTKSTFITNQYDLNEE